MLQKYFKDIFKTYKAGDATEQSYYGDLKKLLVIFLESKNIDPNITITPRKTEAGIPDFSVRKGKELIGYVEAKDVKTENLEKIEYDEQIKRYKEKLPNFILTNYFDFWLWRRDAIDEKKGQWVKKVKIGQSNALKFNTVPPPQNEKDFFELLQAFFSYYIPERKTAKSLAEELANRANLIPSQITYLLNDGKEEEIDRIYNAFKEFLISDLSKEDFADIYAQTITYGLFTARLRQGNNEKFDRFIAERLIPKNIQILHDTFSLISSNALPEAISSYVDDMATVLAHADMERIKKELHREKGGDDPLMHFYETFLAVYDPKKRKARGVYYTPLPVVSYITRSINILLKEKFDKKLGFASDGVTLLDPASGTLTFPSNAIKIAKEEVDKSPNAGSWLQIIKNHILKNYYAFELLMAPYIIGHLKASLILEDLGYKMQGDERFQLYLTNTLDLSDIQQSNIPYVAALSREARIAKKIKEEVPILVIMGNPPYSASSHNKSIFLDGGRVPKERDKKAKVDKWEQVKGILDDYKEGVRNERNIKPLSDDYIKFIRFAHWKIEQAGQGIIGMITNNSYLDGIIHRAMRKKILDDFDEIYILNLHGNSRLREKTPDGGKDENVFDIQQGVGIILLVKTGENKKAIIKYTDQYGLREEKYKFLEIKDIKNTEWQELKLKEPNYFFASRNLKGEEIYQKFISVKDMFNNYNRCVVTSRDEFVIADNKEELQRKINIFINYNLDDESIKQGLKIKESRTWSFSKAKRGLINKGIREELFIEYFYRPFDKKFIYYEDLLLERSRKEIMRHMLKPNLALLLMRQVYWKGLNSHFLVSDSVTDSRIFISNRGAADIFPLYIYNQNEQNQLFNDDDGMRQINFSDKLWGSVPTGIEPERVFYYIYAILYSKIYREKYNEFFKIDFPRIPFTKDAELFYKIADIGKELVDLHLLKSEKLENISVAFPVVGDNKVKKQEYNAKEKRIYINDKQYFGTITPEVWNYHIGGYQVLDKWLKDRKDKVLSLEKVDHFLKVIIALNWTIHFQKEIDKLYPEVEKSLI